MKKWLIIMLSVSVFFVSLTTLKAEEYQNFEEIVFDHDDAKLLKDYTDEDYSEGFKALKKRKFIGWRIDVIESDEGLEFISETKLKIYNNGFSTIKHDISLSTKEEVKYQLSATGGIKISGSGNVKKFKGTINADIKASVSYTSIETKSESYDFQIVVDPMTYVKIVTRGKGIINNGVGKHYFFWVETKKGGWETFNQTTEYYEIIKERI